MNKSTSMTVILTLSILSAMAGSPNDDLITAAQIGDIETVTSLLEKIPKICLLEKVADPETCSPWALEYSLNFALQRAAENGKTKVVKLLLEKGDIDPKYHNSLALFYAAENGQTEVVKLLLAKGADPSARNSRALTWSALNGHIEVVKLLFAKGADPTLAIKYTHQYGHDEMNEMLIKLQKKGRDAI